MEVKFFKEGFSYPRGVREHLKEKYPDINFLGDSVYTTFSKEDTPEQIKQFNEAVSEMQEKYSCFEGDSIAAFFRSLASAARAEGRELDALVIEEMYLNNNDDD